MSEKQETIDDYVSATKNFSRMIPPPYGKRINNGDAPDGKRGEVMSENNETHAQIVAELRDLSKCIKHKIELGEYIYAPLPTVEGKPLDVYFAELADRLETSTKRERETTGNPAELREALILCVDSARCIANHAGFSSRIASEALVIVNAAADALAAPARNCDVYDKEEVRMAYHLHGDGLMTMQAVVDWLYSAKKRGDESPRTEQESEVQI